jgi:ribosomal protein L17
MLALGNQTLVNRTGQHRDALVPDLVAEVLAGDADGTTAGRTQDIHIQVLPLLSGHHRASSGDQRRASTPALVGVTGAGQVPLLPVAVKLRPTGFL